MPDLVSVFRFARELLSDQQRWTQKAQARDENGKLCWPSSPRATTWDIEGAVALASGGAIRLEALRILDWASVELYGDVRPFAGEEARWAGGKYRGAMKQVFNEMLLERAVEVNDKIGYDAVLRVLDRAIELAGEVE
jgi:hypothetical protein